MNLDFIQELYRRYAIFAKLDSKNPFSVDHPTIVMVNLTHDEAKELKQLSFERETQELSKRRCGGCSVGMIVKKIIKDPSSNNGLQVIRYNCTCDGAAPIDPSEWTPIGEK